MATKEFILQGLTARTHAAALREMFEISEVKRAILSVAYVNQSGVRQIEEKLQNHAAYVTVFAGIRNGVTSHQGLARLQSIPGLTLYAVDTGSRNVVFHPKLYLVCGKDIANLVIGSANLTWADLSRNIEAGLLLHLNLKDAADRVVVDQVGSLLGSLPTDHPGNVVKIGALSELDELLASGLVEDEALFSPPQSHPPRGGTAEAAKVPLIMLKTKSLAPLLTKPLTKLIAPTAKAAPSPNGQTARSYVPVWQSNPLRRSNINLFTSKSASKKNILSLGQGGWTTKINFQDYFRNDVFGSVKWTPSDTAGVDEAYADFEFILNAINYGVFRLRVRYSESLKTVEENNVTTRLVWGPLLSIVSNKANLGRVVYLYRDINDSERFLLEID